MMAAQRAFFLFQSSATETVPGNFATNITITLTYSNASGTINNAVFTNGVSVVVSGIGVTASLAPLSPAIATGGTATLPLTISATTGDQPNATYQIIINVTNNAFNANTPIPGVASITNILTTQGPPNSNSFLIALSPS